MSKDKLKEPQRTRVRVNIPHRSKTLALRIQKARTIGEAVAVRVRPVKEVEGVMQKSIQGGVSKMSPQA